MECPHETWKPLCVYEIDAWQAMCTHTFLIYNKDLLQEICICYCVRLDFQSLSLGQICWFCCVCICARAVLNIGATKKIWKVFSTGVNRKLFVHSVVVQFSFFNVVVFKTPAYTKTLHCLQCTESSFNKSQSCKTKFMPV